MKGRWRTVGVVTAVAIVAVASLAGARSALVKRVGPGERDSESAWAQRLALLDRALATQDLSRVLYEWRQAHGAAVGSGRWDALIAVGDAALRIEAAAGRSGALRADAREAYLGALFRARALRASGGVAEAVAALERLGDAEALERGRQVARAIARDHEAHAWTHDAAVRALRVYSPWP